MRAWAENQTQLHRTIRREYSYVMRGFSEAVGKALGRPTTNLRKQLDFLIGALTYTMAETTEQDLESTAAALVEFAAAGLRRASQVESAGLSAESSAESSAEPAAGPKRTTTPDFVDRPVEKPA